MGGRARWSVLHTCVPVIFFSIWGGGGEGRREGRPRVFSGTLAVQEEFFKMEGVSIQMDCVAQLRGEGGERSDQASSPTVSVPLSLSVPLRFFLYFYFYF